MTAAEKQERQRQRRKEKRQGAQNLMDADAYQSQVDKTMRRLERAFLELASENDPGRISVERQGEDSLVISVKRVGDYTFSSDPTS